MHHYLIQIYERPCDARDFVPEWLIETFPYGEDLPIEYVTFCKNRQKAITDFSDWLANQNLGSCDGIKFMLNEDAADHYFVGVFPRFVESVSLLTKVTETEYIHDTDKVSKLLSKLLDSYESWKGTLVMIADQRPMPMDRFIRTAVPGKKYYIAAVLDYH